MADGNVVMANGEDWNDRWEKMGWQKGKYVDEEDYGMVHREN